MKAWWFSEGKTLPHDDGRRIALGQTHKVKGEIIPCRNGLHASKRIIDALRYAPGLIVWRVELSGTVIDRGNKFVASERTYVAGGVDASNTLRKFARLCALDVIDLWTAPEIVVRYLKTGDESIRAAAWDAAGDAAGDAAWAAAWDAAWDAAWAAARAAAWAAAWDAAGDAAWAAARAAAWAAAGDAAREKQNKRLTQMIYRHIKGAAK